MPECDIAPAAADLPDALLEADARLDELTLAILAALAEAEGDAGMSLPRLGKRLGLRASVLMRRLTQLGPARLGGVDGPGWVQVTQHDERWRARLTDAGRALCTRRVRPRTG